MWCLRWAGWVALVALAPGLVLGETHISYNPPVYLYEFGDLEHQTVHFTTDGHIRPGQRFVKVDITPFPCVRRVGFVRVVVLNAHNPAHVSVRENSVYIQYALAENPRSTYFVSASRTGSRDPKCLHRLEDMMNKNRNRLTEYQLQMLSRQGYPLQHGFYPGHVTSLHRGQHPGWSDEYHDNDYDIDNNVDGSDVTLANKKAHGHKDSFSEYSSESRNVDDEPNNEQFRKENGKEQHEAKNEPVWKLKRQRKKKKNNTAEVTPQVNNVEEQDVEDPYNMTETVKFGLNSTIFRRTSPVSTVHEEIIEEFITPEEFISQSTMPDGVSVIPGFTYQFFNLPSSSEATVAELPLPENLPKDQNEWGAYFKNLIESNSTVVVTEKPILVAAGFAAPIPV